MSEQLDADAEAARIRLKIQLQQYLRPDGLIPRRDHTLLRLNCTPAMADVLADTFFIAWRSKVLLVESGRGGLIVHVEPAKMPEVLHGLAP